MLCIHCNKLIANVCIKSINTTIVAKRDYLCGTQIDLIENAQYNKECLSVCLSVCVHSLINALK